MRPDRKGIISLPIKLMVSFLIISLMVPVVATTVEDLQNDMDDKELTNCVERIRSELSKVSSRSVNFVMQSEFTVPEGCHIILGEGDGRIISAFRDDGHVIDTVTEFKVIDRIVLYGDVLLRISNGDEGIEVKEL